MKKLCVFTLLAAICGCAANEPAYNADYEAKYMEKCGGLITAQAPSMKGTPGLVSEFCACTYTELKRTHPSPLPLKEAFGDGTPLGFEGSMPCHANLLGNMRGTELQNSLTGQGTPLRAKDLQANPYMREQMMDGIVAQAMERFPSVSKATATVYLECFMDFSLKNYPEDVRQAGEIYADSAAFLRFYDHCGPAWDAFQSEKGEPAR